MDSETNFALWLLTLFEDREIQIAKMKAFIMSLPEAKQPDFSLARLLRETTQAADTVRDLQIRFAEVRGMLLESPLREREAREAIRHAIDPKWSQR